MKYGFSRRALWAVVVAGLLGGGCQGLFSDLNIEFQGEEEPVEENQNGPKNQEDPENNGEDCRSGERWSAEGEGCVETCSTTGDCGDLERCDEDLLVCVPLEDLCEDIVCDDGICDPETGRCEPLEAQVCDACEAAQYCHYDTLSCVEAPYPPPPLCVGAGGSDRCSNIGAPSWGPMVAMDQISIEDESSGLFAFLGLHDWFSADLFDERKEITTLVFELYGLNQNLQGPQNFELFVHSGSRLPGELAVRASGFEHGSWIPRSRFGAAEFEPGPHADEDDFVSAYGGIIWVPAELLFGDLFEFELVQLYLPLEQIRFNGQWSRQNNELNGYLEGVVLESSIIELMNEMSAWCGCDGPLMDTAGCGSADCVVEECGYLVSMCEPFYAYHLNIDVAAPEPALSFQFEFHTSQVTETVSVQ